VAASIPLPAGPPLDAASWAQPPLVVRHIILQLLDDLQQLQTTIQHLEARTTRSGAQGIPGAKPGHPRHRQALLAPTEVIEVSPEPCACGQTVFPDTRPFHTHQVIELPEIQMMVRHFVLHEARRSQCDRVIKAQVPPEAQASYGPRLTALIGELSGSQRDSRSAVQEFCRSVWVVCLSRGAVQRAVDRVSEAIKPHYAAIAEKVRRADDQLH
jgi:transposase